jgi:hypothetical protein
MEARPEAADLDMVAEPDPKPHKLPNSHPAADHPGEPLTEYSHLRPSAATHQAVLPHQISASANSDPTTSAHKVPPVPKVFPEFQAVMHSTVWMAFLVLLPKTLAPNIKLTARASIAPPDLKDLLDQTDALEHEV